MLFNSVLFLFGFLPVTYIVFWLLRTAQQRYFWLAITGYVFYGYWDWRFCLLMLFSTLVSYLSGLGFLAAKTEYQRKLLLVVPITVDLLLLGFFKYANFAWSTVCDTVGLFGADLPRLGIQIILPVGISFYTFHTITYIVDSYRGVIKPTRNFFEFAAYVSLFSQLVAGPIVRFRQIEEDLEKLGSADWRRWLAVGVCFFLFGMVEKVIVADYLAFYVDPAFQRAETLSTLDTWLVALAYTFQLYFDFCGYSTMAVGLGYMFGLRIPKNFHSPYKAVNPSDFWQRWHISLSTCLRDYLYIPLGGNRGGAWGTYRNLMLTMLIGGLWHGANWTFIIWGGYHGALLVLHRLFPNPWDRLPALVRQLLFFLLVVIGWVFFRAENLSVALAILKAMFFPTTGIPIENVEVLWAFLAIAGTWAMFGPNAFDVFADYRWRWWHLYPMSITFGACLAIIASGRNSPFLYFQF